MASRIIGRAECPECGFDAAHVKESEKCVYRYCPECGSQTHARTERQRAAMVGRMRPVASANDDKFDPPPATPGASAPPPPPPEEPAPAVATATVPSGSGTPDPVAPPKPKRRGLFT